MNTIKKTVAAGTVPATSAPPRDCRNFFSVAFWKTTTINDIKRELNQGANLEARGRSGWTSLHAAAGTSKVPAVVELLLDHGAALKARDKNGRPPLHVAARLSKTPAVVELLLDRGADLKAGDKDGWTPLHVAAGFSKTPAVVELLLDRGADLKARDKDGHTPLHAAARFSKTPAVVELLLDRGADLKARDKDGHTPLHAAARFSKTPAVVELLLDCGADLKAGDKDGWTPLHVAAGFSKTPAVVELLLDRGADLEARCLCPHWAIPVFSLGSGSTDVKAVRWTPLHTAAAHSKTPAVVELLLDRGADLKATDKDGHTPLHAAAGFSKTPAVVELLLDRGADLKARCPCPHWAIPTYLFKSGFADVEAVRWTPLHTAAAISKTTEVVELLLNRGANPRASDDLGMTPACYAEKNIHREDHIGIDRHVYWRMMGWW